MQDKSTFCHNCNHNNVLTEKSNRVEWTEKIKQHQSNNKLFTFHSHYSKDVSPFNATQENKKSFLVPYLTFSEDQIQLEILRTLIKQDNKGNHYLQYVLGVELLNKKWTFNRRWKDFNELHNILSQLFPENFLPQFIPGKLSMSEHLGRQQEIESRRSALEEYTRQLLNLSQIRNSRIMQKFLKVNKEYVPFL